MCALNEYSYGRLVVLFEEPINISEFYRITSKLSAGRNPGGSSMPGMEKIVIGSRYRFPTDFEWVCISGVKPPMNPAQVHNGDFRQDFFLSIEKL